MTVFVDTSDFLAVLDADDLNHEKAKRTWEDLINKVFCFDQHFEEHGYANILVGEK